MATTQILPWAPSGSANIESQASYAVDTSLNTGYPYDAILPSATLNKTLRQSTFMAAGLANWMVVQGVSVPDDGDLSALVGNISTALTTFIGGGTSSGSFVNLSASGVVSGTGFTNYFASPPAIGSTAANTGAFTTLSASGTVSGIGFSNYLNAPPAIGGGTANSGAFTTLSASSTVSGSGFSTYLASPPAIGGTAPNTGTFTTLQTTGLATLSSLTSSAATISGGSIDNAIIGGTTAAAITGTTITANTKLVSPYLDAVSSVSGGSLRNSVGTALMTWGAGSALVSFSAAVAMSPASANIIISPTGTGTVTIAPATPSTMDNVQIGGTTPKAGAFTTLSASGAVSGTGFSNYLAAPPAIGGTTANSGTFTTLGATSLSLSTALGISSGGTNSSTAPSAGAVVFGTGTAYSSTAVGTTNQVLLSAGAGTPIWVNQSAIAAGTATTATNIAGGLAGSIPYQSAVGTTTFLSAGTGVLVGGSTPTYSTTPTLTGTNFSGIPNAALNNSSITINGNAVSLGGTTTVTASTTNAVTFNNLGTGAISGTTFDGSAARTISYNTIGAPKADGTNATGTWGISVTGNAATVTNGLYSTGSYSNPAWLTSILGSIVSGAVGSATNLAGGTTGAIHYQTGAGASAFLALGTSGYVVTAGATAPQYTAQSALSVGSATTATNVAGGTAGALNYQTGAGATSFVSLGTTNYVLTAGAAAPQYVAQSTLSVGSATTSTTATNLASGATGSLPYQSGSGSTSFLAIGTTNYVLTAGATAPQYVAQSTLSVGSATTANSASNISGGTAGALHYQSGVGATSFLSLGTTNYVLVAGASAPQYAAQSTLSVGSATTSTNIAGGAAGGIPYQSGSGATAILGAGTAGQVLVSNGALAPYWGNAPAASSATNLAGGAAGQMPYQSASGTTLFTAAGTSGQVLLSGGTGSPTWSASSALSVGSATIASNLAAGTAGQIPYQTGSNTTAFLAVGTGVLVAGLTPSYTTTPTLTGTNFTGIPNGALTNSSITFGATAQALGSTVSALNAVSIGATTASTGAFTTLSASSTVTFSGGTANGVAYLNGSEVLTTGSALVFDGTNFSTTGSATATALIPSGSSVPTNGLFLPAANSVGLSTNTTERLRIDSAGNVAIGPSGTLAGVNLYVNKSLTGATGSRGCLLNSIIQSDVTVSAYGFYSALSTQTASFTVPSLVSFYAIQGTIGAGSTVSNQYGFAANANMTGATSNTGFFSNIASAANTYNFYAGGTAPNYFAGITLIGTTAASGSNYLQVNSDALINGQTVGRGGANVVTNTALGFATLANNTAGNFSTAIGYSALNANTIGVQNTAVGNAALGLNTSGNYNCALGVGTLGSNTTGSSNSAFGLESQAYNTTGNNNSSFGFYSLNQNTTGANNSAFGVESQAYNTTGNNNNSFGFYSLNQNTLGSTQNAFGRFALQSATSVVATLGTITGGSGYTAGTYTGVVMTLSSGSTATIYPTATIVVAGGVVTTVTITSPGSAFKDTTTVLTAPAASIGGTGSGFSVPVATLTTSIGNSAFGDLALRYVTTGNFNSAFGAGAGSNITTGNYNALVGVNAGQAVTTGSNNVILGGYTGSTAPISATGSNYIVLSDGAGNVRQVIDGSGNVYLQSGNLWQYAPAPTAIAAATTLTAAQLQTDIISTTGTTYTVTLPTGSAIDTQFSGVPTTNIGFDFHIVNTASGTITVAVGASGMTSLGTLTVATGASAAFRLRRTAAATYVLYGLS